MWWELAEQLYEFHEGAYWTVLGYDTLRDFLAQPDLGMSHSSFFQAVRLWRDLHVVRGVPTENLGALEPSKVREVHPAIMTGRVTLERGLADAAALGYRDIRERYRGEGPGDDELAAEREPERIQCEHCGSWITPAALREWGGD